MRLPRSLRTALRLLGSVLALAMVAFAAGVLLPEPAAPVPPRAVPFALVDVTVIDTDAGRLVPGQTVVVRGGRISHVGPTVATPVPAGVRRIEARGRYLMPALWDMHAHVLAVSPMLDLPLYVGHGVTRVRDLQGCPMPDDPFLACASDKRRWSAEALAGLRVGPRIVETSSFMANGPGMAARLRGVPAYFDVASPAQARAFVRHFAGRVDTIKVYDRIPPDAWRALVDEADRLGLPVVGHRPHAVDAIEAALRQRSLEHARFLLHDAFDGAAALRAAAGTARWREDRRAMLDQHDPARAQRILDAMRGAGTFYVPTHLTRWSDAYAHTAAVRDDPALRTLHPLLRRQWNEDIDELVAASPSPAQRREYVEFHRRALALTLQAQRSGVRIMAGSDYIAPGVDLHRELALLVEAGLTPAQALRAATLTPAEYMRMQGRAGRVAPGFEADLVLLDADPLDDIRNTRAIRAVVFDGRWLDREALDALDAHVVRQARSWSAGCKMVWRFLRNPVGY